MLGLFFGKEPWLRAKRFGYGAGLPFKWQGWAVLGVYLMAMIGLALLADNDQTIPTFVTVALMLILTGLFTIIVRNHTEGGWKWRGL